jgi:hypothetical protein
MKHYTVEVKRDPTGDKFTLEHNGVVFARDSSIPGLVGRIKSLADDGHFRDGGIYTPLPVTDEKRNDGLTVSEHSLFWETYNPK